MIETNDFENRFSQIYQDYANKYKAIIDYKCWFDHLENLKKNHFDFTKFQKKCKNTIDIIEDKYTKFGLIEIRPHAGEKILTVGCGEEIFNSRCQGHSNEYTINPSIMSNPSCLGHFAGQKFENLPDGVFEEIHCEGIKLFETKCFHEEVQRLLKIGGILGESKKNNWSRRKTTNYISRIKCMFLGILISSRSTIGQNVKNIPNTIKVTN